MKIGRIYKIIHNQSNIVYVGSTFNTLRDRWSEHKKSYLREDPKRNISIYKYFKEHGIDNFKIVLIKEYDVIDRRHLFVYEQLWIGKLHACNEQAAFQPLKNNHHIIYHNNIDYKKSRSEYVKKNNISIQCECGGNYRRFSKLRHFRTKKHLSYKESK